MHVSSPWFRNLLESFVVSVVFLGRFISISRTFKIMQTAWSIDSGGGSVLKMGTKHAMYFFWFERRKKNVHTLVFIFHRSYVITADDEKTHTHRSESKKKGKE